MNPAAVATSVEDIHGDNRWMSIHNRFIADAHEREPDILLIGDSLIQQIIHQEIWTKMLEPLHSLNFGIGGDQTQHVLWRIENGELEYITPKVIVLLVGTNNHDHTADQVAGGLLEIVRVAHEKQPQAQIILVGIPPRGREKNKLREKIATINKSLAEKVEKLPNVMFFNTDPYLFVSQQQEEELISHHDMYDYLHLTKRGYQKLFEPIVEEVQNLLKTFVKVESTAVVTPSEN